jgi:hypothetical protein
MYGRAQGAPIPAPQSLRHISPALSIEEERRVQPAFQEQEWPFVHFWFILTRNTGWPALGYSVLYRTAALTLCLALTYSILESNSFDLTHSIFEYKCQGRKSYLYK